jgi:hypothetical protein
MEMTGDESSVDEAASEDGKGPVQTSEKVAARYSSDEEDTMELFPSPQQQDSGINKRDGNGNLMGRKFDCSATNYKQQLTLSSGSNKVS